MLQFVRFLVVFVFKNDKNKDFGLFVNRITDFVRYI